MPTVRTADLIDSAEVAAILGLTHRNSVTTYTRRYPDFPKPVVVNGRLRLWLRGDIVGWSPTGADPGKPKPSSDHIRSQLIQAAAPLMAERPISDIPVREIAAAAGVAHTLIYRHFGSKAELQRAVVEQAAAEMVQVALQAPEGALASMETIITEMHKRQSSLRVLIQALGTPQGKAVFGTRAPLLEVLMSALRDERASGKSAGTPQLPSLSADVAIGAVGALVVGWIVFEPRINSATGLTDIPIPEIARLCNAILALAAQPTTAP